MNASLRQKSFVIAGGGLAGLFAARVLKSLGAQKIFIIEKADRTGGLLQSIDVKNPLGDGVDYSFDYGTHFVLSPKELKIQDLLFQDLDESRYHRFDQSLQEGHYFNGTLYDASGCVSIQSLPSDVRKKIESEMKTLVEQNVISAPDAKTVEQSCLARYGSTATGFLKDIYKKLTGLNAEELASSMQDKLFPSRMIITDRPESIALKKNPAWDWRIAYADCNDSISDVVKFYPKKGGIGQWLDTLASNLRKGGVEIVTGATIVSLETGDDNSVKSVQLSDGRKIDCDYLIWTLPAIFLALMTKTQVPSSKPQIRSVSLCHFITDQKPVSRPFWITNLDKNFESYRTTLYDNAAPSGLKYRLTVEMLTDAPSVNDNTDKIFQELKTSGIIAPESKKLWSTQTHKAEGFPILKPGLAEIYSEQMDILEKTFPNICFAGRRSDAHGQVAIMRNTYDIVSKVCAA